MVEGLLGFAYAQFKLLAATNDVNLCDSIPFHFKVDTNRQLLSREHPNRGKELETHQKLPKLWYSYELENTKIVLKN
ncbi:hypothetical protein DP117_10445 [Brasilonema sp. UFV-L1]|nr:hypothetical protein [Brasilonema sp. UFV-L1]